MTAGLNTNSFQRSIDNISLFLCVMWPCSTIYARSQQVQQQDINKQTFSPDSVHIIRFGTSRCVLCIYKVRWICAGEKSGSVVRRMVPEFLFSIGTEQITGPLALQAQSGRKFFDMENLGLLEKRKTQTNTKQIRASKHTHN